MNFLDDKLPAVFWAKAVPEPNSGCWLWLAALQSFGYGVIRIGRVARYAAHLTYEASCGPVAEDLELKNLCGARCCINPAHWRSRLLGLEQPRKAISMSEQPTAKEPIEDRILEHFTNRVVNEGKSPCDYHVHPLDFQDLVQRTGARVKEDHLSAFVDLAFSAGETSVFPDPQIVRGSCEPWERGQDANVIVTARAERKRLEERLARAQSALSPPSQPQLVRLVGKALLERALLLVSSDPRDYPSATLLIGAYETLMRSGPFGCPAGLESGALPSDSSDPLRAEREGLGVEH